jgi:hypothetical protein
MVYRGGKRNKYKKMKVKQDIAKTTGYFIWGLVMKVFSNKLG